MDGTTKNPVQMTTMPDGMRIVMAILFFCIAVFFAASITDSYLTNSYVSSDGAETDAIIIDKKTTHNKYGYRYYVTYTFRDKEKEYRRRRLFGLLPKATEITKGEYDRLETGAVMPVLYCVSNPAHNRPKTISITSNKNVWFFIGAIVFGGVSLNEFRAFINRKFKFRR